MSKAEVPDHSKKNILTPLFNHMSKILVIGCGNVGSVGLHKMAQFPKTFYEIHVVARTQKKVEAVRASVLKKSKGKVDLHIHIVDVGKGDNLLKLLNEVKPVLVVNWAARMII